MTAATTCAKCYRATSPLPTDWSALDFFDRPVAAQDAVFRTRCTVVVDAEKPCLKPAPAAPSSTTELTPHQKTGLQACYQIEAMLRSLLLTAHHGDMEDLPHLLQATLPRLVELNSVSMSGHDQDSEDVPSMIDRLHGGYTKLAQGGAV